MHLFVQGEIPLPLSLFCSLTDVFFNIEVKNLSLCSSVAQLVERVAVNHLVGGSSPSRGAIFVQSPVFIDRAFFICMYQFNCNQ